MTAHPRPAESPAAPLRTTLLDLVTRLTATTETAEETVQAAMSLLDSGRAELTGNFRGVCLRLEAAPELPGAAAS